MTTSVFNEISSQSGDKLQPNWYSGQSLSRTLRLAGLKFRTKGMNKDPRIIKFVDDNGDLELETDARLSNVRTAVAKVFGDDLIWDLNPIEVTTLDYYAQGLIPPHMEPKAPVIVTYKEFAIAKKAGSISHIDAIEMLEDYVDALGVEADYREGRAWVTKPDPYAELVAKLELAKNFLKLNRFEGCYKELEDKMKDVKEPPTEDEKPAITAAECKGAIDYFVKFTTNYPTDTKERTRVQYGYPSYKDGVFTESHTVLADRYGKVSAKKGRDMLKHLKAEFPSLVEYYPLSSVLSSTALLLKDVDYGVDEEKVHGLAAGWLISKKGELIFNGTSKTSLRFYFPTK